MRWRSKLSHKFDTSSCYLLSYYTENTFPKSISFKAWKKACKIVKADVLPRWRNWGSDRLGDWLVVEPGYECTSTYVCSDTLSRAPGCHTISEPEKGWAEGKKSWQNSGDKAAAITKLYTVFFGIKFGDLKLPILLKTYSKTHHLLLFMTIIIWFLQKQTARQDVECKWLISEVQWEGTEVRQRREGDQCRVY